MSQTDPAPAATEEQYKQGGRRVWQATPGEVWKAFDKLVESFTPWLVEFGSWLFGGLIAFTLLVMASLITVGPVDPAITVATATFALALPLNITGLFLLRLVQDLKHVGFEEEAAQAFQEVGFIGGAQIASPTALEALRKRRTRIVLGSCLGILALGVVLTLTGMIAALWHMAWWIGVVFFVMVLICLGIVTVALVASRLPDSEDEREQKRRYREEMTRQAKEQHKKSEKRA